MLLSPAGNTASTYIQFCFFPPFSQPKKKTAFKQIKNTKQHLGVAQFSAGGWEIEEGIKSQVITAPCRF